MQKYHTVQGDTFDLIAYKVYGSSCEIYAMEIAKVNNKYIKVIFFPAGISLNIPPEPKKISKNLPFWKLNND